MRAPLPRLPPAIPAAEADFPIAPLPEKFHRYFNVDRNELDC